MEFLPPSESSSYFENYLFRKKYHKRAVRVLRNLTSSISCLANGVGNDDDNGSRGNYLLSSLKDYLRMTPTNPKKTEHLEIFEYYGIPNFLVYLYKSPIRNNKEIADESIRLFLYPNIQSFPIYIQHRFYCVVLLFCNLLRDDFKTTRTSEHLLYYSCRQTYESLMKSIGVANFPKYFCLTPGALVRDINPFVRELTRQLLRNMKLIRDSCFCMVPSWLKSQFESDIGEFSILTLHTCTNIEQHLRLNDLSLDSLSMVALDVDESYHVEEIKAIYDDFSDLLNSIDLGLTYMDDGVEYVRCTECEFNHGWSYYLSILKELDMISKLYYPAEKNLSSCLCAHRDSINKLIMRSKRGDDHQWLLRHESLINNESRRHLITMMFPNLVENGCCDHQKKKTEVLIDRSKLFFESFQNVGLANPILLRNGIAPQFKNEAALEAGPVVLKEWFLLVCQHLFCPQNSLFVSCPHDPHRFYPSLAKVDSQQLEYYRFCGRVIALALIHDVKIGIGFDRFFFLQLAGSVITLEDICDADPYMYKSCKDILGMDTKLIDSDGLGLTFVWETEQVDESGSRKVVELCPKGSTMVVYSMNREEYIKLVIQHCFVKSIVEKVKLFILGLDDVLTRRRRKKLFTSIELEDLDHILLLDRTICESGRDRNYSELASDSRASPFRRIIDTTLPVSRPRMSSSFLSLTCREQARPFSFLF